MIKGEGWRKRGRRKDEDEGRRGREKGGKKSCEINLLCRAFTQPQTTDMLRQKPRTWRSCLAMIDE